MTGNPKEERLTAIYARCSPADGDDPVRQSTHAQINELMALAKKRGCEHVAIYGDNGGTGVDFWREGFQYLFNDARQGRIGCILMTNVSRLGCESDSVIQMEKRFKDMGVEIVYAHAAFGNGSMEDFIQGMHSYMEDILSFIPDEDEVP